MRILVLGGTGLTGPFIVRELIASGHDVVIFHRGETETDILPEVPHIHGQREHVADFLADFKRLAPDVILDMLPHNDRDASVVMDAFRGVAARVVGISSQDVYRAYDVLWRRDEGPIQAVPLTEDAGLRTRLYPDGPDYDKILAERIIMGDPALPGTVLRYPMVYGPNDGGRILGELQRMDADRPAIFLDQRLTRWRGPRGYAENVAHATVLAATDDRATGRIYNVADPEALSMFEWVEKIGEVANWRGQIIPLAAEQLPTHLRREHRWEQDWIVDTTRIREELGYTETVSLQEALRRTVAWWRTAPSDAVLPALVRTVEEEGYAAEDALFEVLEGRGV